MKKLVIILLSFLAFTAFFSCKKTTTVAAGPPKIEFMDLNVVKETQAYFHFKFTDPDGDIGLKDSDTTGDFGFGSPYHFDFHMRLQIFSKITNDWKDTTIFNPSPPPGHMDSLIFLYRIPYIDNQSKDKSLTGEVIVEMTGYRFTTTIKKFRYWFYIYDRAHHKSNVVYTPEFNYP
ncbi:MAG: hypothetical protein ACXVPN_16570 [Bacteroidia bacterium]